MDKDLEIEKYKTLYENEKSHNETLTLIIDKLIKLIPGKDPTISFLKESIESTLRNDDASKL